MKVHIRTTCSFCDGEAYLPVRETVSYSGERYIHHRRCSYCLGSGERDKWVSLREFADLLERATSMESNYQELARVMDDLVTPIRVEITESIEDILPQKGVIHTGCTWLHQE